MNRGMAMVLTLLVLASALFAGWYSTRRVDYFPARLATTFIDCEVIPGEFHRQEVQHPGEDEWFSGDLAAFGEPSLYRRASTAPRSVRFTWLRSFHDPVVVRIDNLGDGRLQLTAKQRPGGAGFPLDRGTRRAREQVRMLQPDEAARLEGMLADSQFFDLSDGGCFRGVHGSQWILEGHDPVKGYRYRHFQSPEQGVERQLGTLMLELTALDVVPIY